MSRCPAFLSKIAYAFGPYCCKGARGAQSRGWRQLKPNNQKPAAQIEALPARGQLAQAAAGRGACRALARAARAVGFAVGAALGKGCAPACGCDPACGCNPAGRRCADRGGLVATFGPDPRCRRESAGRADRCRGSRPGPVDLANRISQLLSAQQQTVVHPEVEWPTQVLAGSTFRLFIAARITRPRTPAMPSW